jgi:parvulin-like peptidyl-prolyl isomerase
MTLGGVIVEVNGTPIYANRLMRAITPALEANAREMDQTQYRNAAVRLIQNQTSVLVRNELEFAAAQRNLEERDKQLVDALTGRWRQEQITQAGGSLELARQRAAEVARRNNLPEDMNFEELVQEKFREYMIRIWVERKIKPRVQITQADMREFYRRHADEEWITQHSQARFRIIQVNPTASGGRQQALDKIRALKDRADRGEDFEKLASQTNDNRALLQKGGDVGWIQKGAYALEKVEEAVWQTQPGQLTGIVEDRGGFYLAEVTAKKEGRVRPFEEQDVQDKIDQRIRGEQMSKLRDTYGEKLEKDATVRSDRNMVATALEMAMQAYPRWRGASASATPTE